MQITAELLLDACRNESAEAGVLITTRLEPLAGPLEPVKPAIYEGGTYQVDRRWFDGDNGPEVVDVVVIDNVASQANRLEAALRAAREALGLPELVLDLSDLPLPVHLPRQISSFQFPHRNGDAYLRDAELDGSRFIATPVGQAIFAATADQPDALFEWMPQALLYGFWQSHLGKKRQQTKLARSWVSEIVGYAPATLDTTTRGLKGDSLNLSIAVGVQYSDDDQLDWSLTDAERKGRKSGDSLAELGHGQVPFPGPGNPAARAAVSFNEIRQQSSVSFAGLRRINAETPDASAAGRALLVALGLAAHADAFSRPFSLRSGCDLRPVEPRWLWLGERDDSNVDALTAESARDLVAETASAARSQGLRVGPDWPQPMTLRPNANLRKVISASWPDRAGE